MLKSIIPALAFRPPEIAVDLYSMNGMNGVTNDLRGVQ